MSKPINAEGNIMSAYVDLCTDIIIARFQLDNINRAEPYAPISQSVVDKVSHNLSELKSSLREMIKEHPDSLPKTASSVRDMIAESVESTIEKNRFMLVAHAQQEAMKLLVGTLLDNEVSSAATASLESKSDEASLWGVNQKYAVNDHLVSRIHDYFQVAIQQFGPNLPLSQKVFVAFGAAKTLNLKESPQLTLGDIKEGVKQLHMRGVIHSDPDSIIERASVNLGSMNKDSRTQMIDMLMSEFELDALSPSHKPPTLDNEPSMGL